jgi:hypothetical protein
VRHIWLPRVRWKLVRKERKRSKNVKGEGKNPESDSLFGNRKRRVGVVDAALEGRHCSALDRKERKNIRLRI